MVSGVTYYKLDASKYGYNGDTTKNCSLSTVEMDDNFNFLRGYDIESFLISGSTLTFTRVNGDTEEVELGSVSGSFSAKYDKEQGVIKLSFNGEDTYLTGITSCDCEEIKAQFEDLVTKINAILCELSGLTENIATLNDAIDAETERATNAENKLALDINNLSLEICHKFNECIESDKEIKQTIIQLSGDTYVAVENLKENIKQQNQIIDSNKSDLESSIDSLKQVVNAEIQRAIDADNANASAIDNLPKDYVTTSTFKTANDTLNKKINNVSDGVSNSIDELKESIDKNADNISQLGNELTDKSLALQNGIDNLADYSNHLAEKINEESDERKNAVANAKEQFSISLENLSSSTEASIAKLNDKIDSISGGEESQETIPELKEELMNVITTNDSKILKKVSANTESIEELSKGKEVLASDLKALSGGTVSNLNEIKASVANNTNAIEDVEDALSDKDEELEKAIEAERNRAITQEILINKKVNANTESIDDNYKELKEQIEVLSSSTTTITEKSNAKISNVESALNTKADASVITNVITPSLEALQVSIQSLQANIKSLNTKDSELEDSINSVKTDITTVYNLLLTKTDNLSALIDANKDDIKALSDKISTLSETVSTISHLLDDANKNIADDESRITSLENYNKIFTDAITSVKASIANLQEQIKNIETTDISTINATVSGKSETGRIIVTVSQESGKLTNVSINESNIATEDEICNEVERAKNAESVITNNIADISGTTKSIKTEVDKISGHTDDIQKILEDLGDIETLKEMTSSVTEAKEKANQALNIVSTINQPDAVVVNGKGELALSYNSKDGSEPRYSQEGLGVKVSDILSGVTHPVNGVEVSTDGVNYKSVLDDEKVAKIDLSKVEHVITSSVTSSLNIGGYSFGDVIPKGTTLVEFIKTLTGYYMKWYLTTITSSDDAVWTDSYAQSVMTNCDVNYNLGEVKSIDSYQFKDGGYYYMIAVPTDVADNLSVKVASFNKDSDPELVGVQFIPVYTYNRYTFFSMGKLTGDKSTSYTIKLAKK